MDNIKPEISFENFENACTRLCPGSNELVDLGIGLPDDMLPNFNVEGFIKPLYMGML